MNFYLKFLNLVGEVTQWHAAAIGKNEGYRLIFVLQFSSTAFNLLISVALSNLSEKAMALLEDIVSSSILEDEAIKAAIKVISQTNRMDDEAGRAFDLYIIGSDAERGQSLVRKTVTDDDLNKLPTVP